MNTNGGNDGAGPPPQLSEQSATVFREGIALVLSRWSALQLAVENEWGGRGSRSVADQLYSDIFSWFTQTKEALYIDDLESILDEAMLSLNTMAEDGSVEEVAEKLIFMYDECLAGNYQSVVTLRQNTPRTARSHVRQNVNDEDNDDSSDDDDDNNTSNMMVDAPESKSQSNSASTPTRETRPSVAAEAEEGWTTVSSSRRSRGKRN